MSLSDQSNIALDGTVSEVIGATLDGQMAAPLSGQNYGAGEVISILIEFSFAVSVVGFP